MASPSYHTLPPCHNAKTVVFTCHFGKLGLPFWQILFAFRDPLTRMFNLGYGEEKGGALGHVWGFLFQLFVATYGDGHGQRWRERRRGGDALRRGNSCRRGQRQRGSDGARDGGRNRARRRSGGGRLRERRGEGKTGETEQREQKHKRSNYWAAKSGAGLNHECDYNEKEEDCKGEKKKNANRLTDFNLRLPIMDLKCNLAGSG